ncbi:MAG: biotin carboxylase N-terminal domain-containing protein [Actinomycetota bacterium]
MSEITTLLIANRGEIAVRIARTARRLGIGTVGVYSEPDVNALHVDAVDVAVALGGSTPAESYLRGEAIIAAALANGADAIHPGYGFLSENAAFARDVEAAGLVWVGPTPEQIELLGDKVAAKRTAIEAGVPTAPMLEIEGASFSGALPDTMPLPVLVKAAAGGGGRGMRIVRSNDEVAAAVAAASREAESAFGDGTVFIEPYLERGRHVEVQVIGDAHGNVVHLGERECSIQRRNQKIVEESPSAGISDETRNALCSGALALAQRVGYRGAGTIEFLVGTAHDGTDGTINFLEVNTRLQVEHPVTEAVTELDLVELQLLVAAGAPLPITQSDVQFSGHAIEVRVVAEDPAAGWLPSTGTVERFMIGDAESGPGRGDGVRVDTGFRDGAVVSPDYDSLLAKVISHASTRRAAALTLARSMRSSQITGLHTNLDSLAEILVEPDYLAAATPTAYLDEHPHVVAAHGPSGADEVALLVAAVLADEAWARPSGAAFGFAPTGWRNLRTTGQRQVWESARGIARHIEFEVRNGAEQAGRERRAIVDVDVAIGPWPLPGDDGALPDDQRERAAVRILDRDIDGDTMRLAIEVDGRRVRVEAGRVAAPTDEVDVAIGGQLGGQTVHVRSAVGAMSWTLAPRFESHDAGADGGGPICPLPGTVIAVHVAAGDRVADGDVLMVVEAMKMEHKITASSDSLVTEVRFAVGDRVDSGDLLVALDQPGQDGNEGGTA